MRRTAPDQKSAAHRHLPKSGLLASAALLLPLLGAAPSSGAEVPGYARLQGTFAAAAAESHVPQSVLLGVAYLQSRWDAHPGTPSVSGGYGPMHLTDARTALATAGQHHSQGGEDPRGDAARATLTPHPAPVPKSTELPARLTTLEHAARLTGIPARQLRTDPAANVRGGAALLADAQRRLGKSLSDDPADWYGAVARFSGADDSATAAGYADDVFAVIRDGAHRTTDTGQRITLTADPGLAPDARQVTAMGLRKAKTDGTECPKTVACEWVPAPYAEFGDGDYGNHDLADRPHDQHVDAIVIHDTEGSWDVSLKLVQDPTYLGWHYTVRSTDGHIAEHMQTKDVGWQAGNWYVNAHSIGIEHEGFLTDPDAWYTEEMYRASARLVAYLADKYDLPLDRQHILGHDTVPATTGSGIPAMHTDPGPYWDWAHYFELLGKPLRATAPNGSGVVTIRPDYATNQPAYTGCTTAGEPCAAHGSSEVRLHTEPSDDAPLLKDIGLRPGGEDSTIDVNDMGSRASTGQSYAVADRKGDWTAIWFLGQKAWFKNPAKHPAAVPTTGVLVTPKAGKSEVPVYGRAYPEASAYPADVPVQAVSPMPYKLLAGQKYVVGNKVTSEYYYAVTFDTASHKVVRGTDVYYEIQFAHRVEYVRAADVDVVHAGR
ncbi:N-acetylmuramoyl-L-alanine amidase [Streptomyces odontomachi]|uniref:N-acetylmuramoyl-L-alanine amidase n=1 Tax=Streptomyces odontomachi TaxID=2944940 RepID=UPI002109BCBC|nr:peptidoglycan recognition family protein [Streptomyces sp. ODS25]